MSELSITNYNTSKPLSSQTLSGNASSQSQDNKVLCNFYLDELLADHKTTDSCTLCSLPVGYHARKPIAMAMNNNPFNINMSGSTSSTSSAAIKELPKWKVD